jgi:magnesium-transporting ATPase (P-type)
VEWIRDGSREFDFGFFTEWRAEVAPVIREGTQNEIPTAELAPADRVVLPAGARMRADGRIVESVHLQIEETALTVNRTQ